ncbi:chromate transporter [Promicromonospora soli]
MRAVGTDGERPGAWVAVEYFAGYLGPIFGQRLLPLSAARYQPVAATRLRQPGSRFGIGGLGVFLKLGSASFGGPIAHVGCDFSTEPVEHRRWLDSCQHADLVALREFRPGPGSKPSRVQHRAAACRALGQPDTVRPSSLRRPDPGHRQPVRVQRRLFEAFHRAGALVFGGGPFGSHCREPESSNPEGSPTPSSSPAKGTQAGPGPLFTFAAYSTRWQRSGPGGMWGALIALVGVFLLDSCCSSTCCRSGTPSAATRA